MVSSANYREKAVAARRMAERSDDPKLKEQYERLAKSWDDLADTAEGIERQNTGRS